MIESTAMRHGSTMEASSIRDVFESKCTLRAVSKLVALPVESAGVESARCTLNEAAIHVIRAVVIHEPSAMVGIGWKLDDRDVPYRVFTPAQLVRAINRCKLVEFLGRPQALEVEAQRRAVMQYIEAAHVSVFRNIHQR